MKITPEEYKQLLEDHILKNKNIINRKNKSQALLNFHLGGQLAFEIALEKFSEIEQYIKELEYEIGNLNDAIQGMAAYEAERAREVSQGMYRE